LTFASLSYVFSSFWAILQQNFLRLVLSGESSWQPDVNENDDVIRQTHFSPLYYNSA